MELDAQQRLQIFCSILRGVTANSTIALAKPERVIEIAVELTEKAITAATAGEHF